MKSNRIQQIKQVGMVLSHLHPDQPFVLTENDEVLLICYRYLWTLHLCAVKESAQARNEWGSMMSV